MKSQGDLNEIIHILNCHPQPLVAAS